MSNSALQEQRLKDELAVKVVAHLVSSQLMSQLLKDPHLSLNGEQCREAVRILAPFVASLLWESRK